MLTRRQFAHDCIRATATSAMVTQISGHGPGTGLTVSLMPASGAILRAAFYEKAAPCQGESYVCVIFFFPVRSNPGQSGRR